MNRHYIVNAFGQERGGRARGLAPGQKSRVLVGHPAEEHTRVTRRKSHRVVEELVSYQAQRCSANPLLGQKAATCPKACDFPSWNAIPGENRRKHQVSNVWLRRSETSRRRNYRRIT